MPSSHPKPSVRTSTFRSVIEHRSNGLAQRLESLPATTPLVVLVVLVVFGVIFRGVIGAICFGLLSLFLAWMLFLTWPRLRPLERLMRASVLLLIVVMTVVFAVPR